MNSNDNNSNDQRIPSSDMENKPVTDIENKDPINNEKQEKSMTRPHEDVAAIKTSPNNDNVTDNSNLDENFKGEIPTKSLVKDDPTMSHTKTAVVELKPKNTDTLKIGVDYFSSKIQKPEDFAFPFISDATKAFKDKDEKKDQIFSVLIYPKKEQAKKALDLFNKESHSKALKATTAFAKETNSIENIDVLFSTAEDLSVLFEDGIIKIQPFTLAAFFDLDVAIESSFEDHTSFILEHLHRNCQKIIFSKSPNPVVTKYADDFLKCPKIANTKDKKIKLPTSIFDKIDQSLLLCLGPEKFKIILANIQSNPLQKALIYANTKIIVDWLDAKFKGNDIDSQKPSIDSSNIVKLKAESNDNKNNPCLFISTAESIKNFPKNYFTNVYAFDLPKKGEVYIELLNLIDTENKNESNNKFTSLVCDTYDHHYSEIKKYIGDKLPMPTHPSRDILEIKDKAHNLPYKELFPPMRDFRSRGDNRTSYGRPPSKDFSRGDTRQPRSRDAQQKTRSGGGYNRNYNKNTSRPDTRNNERPTTRVRGGSRGEYQRSRVKPRTYGSKATVPVPITKSTGLLSKIKKFFKG